MPSNHLILCRPLLLPPSIFPSLRVFYSEWALCIRWPKYWCFSFSISPSKEYSELISFPFSWLSLSESHCYRPFSALASDPSGGVWGHFPSVAASLSSVHGIFQARVLEWAAIAFSITNSRSLLKLTSIESVMSSNHLILYHPLFLLPSVFLCIRVFSNERALCIR